jgi:hypothetical protein
MRTVARNAFLVAIAALMPGCQHHSELTYQPRLELDQLVPGLQTPDNSYLLLTDEQTRGRFVCGLAIAKFAPAEDDAALELVAVKPNEQAYWTERLAGVSAVRELVFLSPIDTRSGGQAADALCAVADRLDTALLLVYAPNHFGPNSAQVLGVLYDTQQRRPIATLHTSAQILEEDGTEESPAERPGDHRDTDAAYRAPRDFERQALACVLELVSRDAPAPTTQPHRWQAPDFDERWWIPRRIEIR